MMTDPKTNLLLSALIIGLTSCGGEPGLQEKKEALEAKKVELAKLQNAINKLEEELAMADSSVIEDDESGILVRVKELVPENFEHHFEVNGGIAAVEIANVSPEQGGQIKEVSVQEGDKVAKDATLARLNTAVVQRNLEELDNGIELAQTVFDRQSKLWEKGIGSEMQYLQAKNNLDGLQKKRATVQAQMELSVIKAPFSGVVDIIHQKEGELAAPGMPILTLVNMAEMKVLADVSENYVKAVRPNAVVEVNFPSFGINTEARIRSVGNIINPANRTFRIEARVPNPNGFLKPNGVAKLKIQDYAARDVLVVPTISIGKDAKGDFLFVVENNGGMKAVKRYVETGRSGNGSTMVISGVEKGDLVVVEGFNEVANGDIVRVNEGVD